MGMRRFGWTSRDAHQATTCSRLTRRRAVPQLAAEWAHAQASALRFASIPDRTRTRIIGHPETGDGRPTASDPPLGASADYGDRRFGYGQSSRASGLNRFGYPKNVDAIARGLVEFELVRRRQRSASRLQGVDSRGQNVTCVPSFSPKLDVRIATMPVPLNSHGP